MEKFFEKKQLKEELRTVGRQICGFAKDFTYGISEIADVSARIMKKLLIFALGMYVLTYFFPPLAEKLPALHEASNLILSFINWVFSVVFGTLHAIFAGEYACFTKEVNKSMALGWQELVNFLSGLM